MKALVTFSMLADVQSHGEAEALALACRSAAWMNVTERLEARGASADDLSEVLTVFEPSVAYVLDLETA